MRAGGGGKSTLKNGQVVHVNKSSYRVLQLIAEGMT